MKDVCQALRLTHVESGLPDLLEQARRENQTYETFLRQVLTREVEGRERQAQQARLKAARLPMRKTLEEFDFAFQPSIAERQVRELADLAFIKTATNGVLLGPPGVGKTHLALSLAVRALEAGYSVRFTTLAQLAQDLASAPHPSRLRQRLRRYLRPKLLILDEIGYTKLTEDQANHLFALVRDRYEQGATILTSNTSFVSVGNAVGQCSARQCPA